METIVTHIEYLLRHHDCVILPGIGAFIVTHYCARLDSDKGVFLPPHKEICFNPAVCNDDGLLINSISRKESISYEDARTEMQRSISALKENLRRSSEITLGGIGILSLSHDETVTFRPRYSAEKYFDLSGTPAISIPSLSQIDHTDENSATTDSSNIEREGAKKPIRSGKNTIFKKSGYYYIAINKRLAHAAACVALIAMICLGFSIPLSDKSLPAEANILPIAKIIKDNVTASTANSVDSPEKNEHYLLAVAAFQTEKEADTFIADHIKYGYTLGKESTKTGWLVTAGESTDKSALLSKSRTSHFKSRFRTSWIWKK